MLTVVNPATEELVRTLDEDTPDSVRDKAERARRAQRTWSATPLDQRQTTIARFLALLEQDAERLARILARVDAGTAYWNCCDRVSPRLPWSGRKHSGIGATLSTMGIRAFVRPKAYHLEHPSPAPNVNR